MTRRNLFLIGMLALQSLLLGARWVGSDEGQSTGGGLLLPNLEIQRVRQVVVQKSGDDGERLTLKRQGTGWVVAEAFDYSADGEKVEQALRDLSGLEIAHTVSSTEHHHRSLKVADDAYERRVTLKLEDGDQVGVLIGTSGRGGSVHARVFGETDVQSVRDYSPWRMTTSPTSWIDKTFFEVDAARVLALEVRTAEQQFAVDREGDVWTLRDAGPADPRKVEDLVGALDEIVLSGVESRRGDAKLGEHVATARFTLGAPAEGDEAAQSTPVDTRELALYAHPDEANTNLLVETDSHVVEVPRWRVKALLDADPTALRLATKGDDPAP